jgi:hypothetical protein
MFKIQKLDFLISFYIACVCISELMGGKTFPIMNIGSFQLSASVAIFVLPLVYSINDMIVEVYGKDRARSVVRSGLLVITFLLLFSLLATYLSPTARFATSEKAYELIFGISARISASSLTAFTLAEFTDVFVFAKLRKRFGKKALWFRTNISNFISQFLDTSVFITLAFYSFAKTPSENWPFLVGLILPYWIIKCLMSLIETPLVYIGVKWLNK